MFSKTSFLIRAIVEGSKRNLRSRNLLLLATITVGALAILYFSRPAAAANITWNGLGGDNNWSTGANWIGGTPPGTNDVAVFDGTSTKNATIDVSVNVQGIQINSGYTGAITQATGASVTVGSSDFIQAGGAFTGSSNNDAINVSGNFVLSGGTFTSTKGSLTLTGSHYTHQSGGTFLHNSGTVTFAFVGSNPVVTLNGSENFNNLNFADSNADDRILFGTVVAQGALALIDGSFTSNGAVEAQAGVSIAPTFDGGNNMLLITAGDGLPRTITFAAGSKLLNVKLNASNVTINTSGSGTLAWQDVTLQAGTINQGAVDFVFAGSNNQVYNQSGGTFNGSANAITCNNVFTLSGGAFNGGGGNIVMNERLAINGGIFTSTSNTLSIAKSYNHNSGGTFLHNSGTVTFTGSSSGEQLSTPALGETFNNLNFSRTSGADIAVFGHVIAVGNLALTDGSIIGGSGNILEAQGGLTIASTFGGGSDTLAIKPNPNLPPTPRAITFGAGANLLLAVLNDPNVTINTSGSGTLAWQSLTLQAGTINQGGVDFTFSNFYDQSGGTFNASTNLLTFSSANNSTFTQSGGTFLGGSGNIVMNANCTISSGTFTSTSGTLFLAARFSHNSGAGTFNHNNGTVTFDSDLSHFDPSISVADAANGGETFNNLNFSDANGVNKFISGAPIALGALAFNDGNLVAGASGPLTRVEARGAVTVAPTFDGGNMNVVFSGSANQTFTNGGGPNLTGAWTIDKSAGAVTLASDLTLQAAQQLNITQGILDQGASFNLTAGAITIGANGTLRDFGTGDLSLGGSLTNNGVFNFNGGGTACSDPNVADQILIRSSSSGTPRSWVGSGTFSVVDVDVQDENASTIVGGITAFGSSVINNSPGWIVDPGCPITVTSQPTSVSACPGSPASFTVAVSGSGPTFQWRKNGVSLSDGGNISGATSPTLGINPVGAADTASYDAVGANPFGVTATSSAVTLSLKSLPFIISNPTNLTKCAGQPATFSVSASGDGLTFQWRHNGTPLSNGGNILGANTPSLTVNPTTTGDGGTYDVIVTGDCNPPAPSLPATLTVNTAPAVSTNPANATFCESTTASFSAAANGSPSPTVQWQVSTDGGTSFNDIPGATSTTLSFTANASQSGNKFRAVFINACNTANTTPATLTVNTAPTVGTNPANATFCEGATASFTAAASGSPSPAVQWQVSTDGGASFNDIPGATSTTLSFTANASQSGNKFRAVFTNSCSGSNSTAATLTVDGFSLSSSSQDFTFIGGSGSVNVITGSTCSWTASSNDSFIHITSGGGGTGNGPVNFTVDPVVAGPRSGTMTIAGKTFTVNENTPTATAGTIEGRVVDDTGQPLSGVVIQLSGTQTRKTITDAGGAYHFDNVETTGFYIARPGRVNYSFSPGERSFSQLGQRTEATFTAIATGEAANPLDTPEYFVRQQYLDFLGREPDDGGFNYWSDQILACGINQDCNRARRLDVSAAFFIEQEFQQTGSFVYRMYKASLGRQPNFAEFTSDRSKVIGGANLDERLQAFAQEWVTRDQFRQAYPDAISATEFVNHLFDTAGLQAFDLRQQQIDAITVNGKTRAAVLRDLINIPEFRTREYDPSFVLMQYFGYLRRDADHFGYDFWLNILSNREPSNYRGMVCSFITSSEYQQRFGSLVSHNNSECRQ